MPTRNWTIIADEPPTAASASDPTNWPTITASTVL